ncbi:heat stress transcription factor B-4-like protein [Tanacetum coccineum]
MVLEDQTGWKLRRKQWTGTTEQLIEDLESAYGRVYVSGHQDIIDIVDIDLFTIVALNMMVVKLGYTCEYEPLFYNYLRPLTSLDEGLYALACEEDVRCLATLDRSFKLIEVYIEHDVTALDYYIRPPRFRATIEDITDKPGRIAANGTKKMLLLTWHESSEPIKELVCDSVTPSSLPQHDLSTHCKVFVCDSITPRCMPDCMLTPPTDESVITYTQLSGVIDDVMRQLSFEETKFDGEAGFADVAGSGVESSRLSHDESFGVDDLDLNLNEPVNLNVSQIETQFELPVYEELDVGRTQKPIVVEVSNQEPIVAEVSTQGNGQEDEAAPSDGQFFYDDEGIDTAYETKYDVQSSEDAGTYDDDDEEEDFLVDEEKELVEPDVDVHLFGISIDLPFDNIGVTNLVPDDVLEGEDVDVINADGFDSDPGNDNETNDYRRRRLAELSREMEGVINASGQWKRNSMLYKNDSVRIRSRCDEKVPVFSMSQGTGPTGPNMWNVMVNPNIPVKAVQDQLQHELKLRVSMSKAFRVKAKTEREIRGDHGFRACRRDLLGLDGAFMKGPFPGQVLAAVGLDSNNGIYPLAYALVEAGTGIYKDLLWRAASATSVKEFEKRMLEPKTMNPKAHEWLNKIPPEHWARSHFSGRAKSDLLLNNICKVFNGKIVGGRDKPVIILFECIREYCMKRIMNVQSVIEKCTSLLTPTATRIMESIKKEAHLMKVHWNGANKYQVSGSLGDQCIVDVVTMTCSCRKWELTGIPCK